MNIKKKNEKNIMNIQPKISIIVLVFNAEKQLQICINSINISLCNYIDWVDSDDNIAEDMFKKSYRLSVIYNANYYRYRCGIRFHTFFAR